MINLVPASAQKMLRHEYCIRVFSVWALLLSSVLVASTILLIPTYVLYTRQIQVATSESESHKTDADAFARLSGTLTEANTFASQLSVALDSVRASEVLAHVERARPAEVALAGLAVAEGKKGRQIEARGTARTREALRHFTDALKRDAFFLDASVPISDLAPDTDLTFSVTLTLRPSS